jgi:hypothetical protein
MIGITRQFVLLVRDIRRSKPGRPFWIEYPPTDAEKTYRAMEKFYANGVDTLARTGSGDMEEELTWSEFRSIYFDWFGKQSPTSRADFELQSKQRIIKAGLLPIRADYDSTGNCTTCGESGRCPGWHAIGESTP